MRHKWKEIERFVDKCACGVFRFRAGKNERRYPQYAHTRDGARLEFAPECSDTSPQTSDKQKTFEW